MAKYSVLIVDDDIWMQRILSKTLNSYGFNDIHLASNGYDGIAIAVEHKPTLIILDIVMPELTGHIILKMLKTIKITKDIPIIMVSALSDIENFGKSIQTGAIAFISKPFKRITIYDKLVEVFGKEILDMIASGHDIDEVKKYYDSHIFEKKEVAYQPMFDDNPDEAELLNTADSTQSNVAPNKISSYYTDEDKRTIESIKKMLLKNKK
jgi:CheY-like chemotaxis protein